MNSTTTTININMNHQDEEKMNRDIRFHRRDIMKECPELSIEAAHHLATQRAARRATLPNGGVPTRKQKAVAKTGAMHTKRISEDKLDATKTVLTVKTITAAVTKKGHVHWSDPVQSTFFFVEPKKETAEESTATVAQPEKQQYEIPQGCGGDELVSITIQQALRQSTSNSSLLWNTKAACVTIIVRMAVLVYCAHQRHPAMELEELEPSIHRDLVVLGLVITVIFSFALVRLSPFCYRSDYSDPRCECNDEIQN